MTRLLVARVPLAAMLAALATAAAGCAARSWSAPIGEFQTNVDRSVVVVSAYYAALNDYERHLYLEEAYADPTVEILLTDAQGRRTPLGGQVFSPRAIRARTDAMALVGLYARRLAALAGSSAPATFAKNASALGAGLKQLPATLSDLTGTDPRAAAYVKPVSSLIGAIGQMYLEAQRDKALRDAIRDGAPAVRTILDALSSDLAAAVDPLQRTGQEEVLAQLVVDYNDQRGTWSESRRRKQITDIEKAARGYATAVVFNPSDVLDSLSAAHEALVAFAASPRGPADRETLTSALAIFAGRVDTAAAAVRALNDVE